MTKLTHHPLNRRVYETLQGMLLRGELALGSQLDERELADRLAVSRTPLREAIAQLVRDELVEYRPYRGNFVRTFSAKQVNDLYLVRRSLESLAMRLAIPKLSSEDIDQVRAILNDVEAALNADDMEAFAVADQRFHRFFIRAADNETLSYTLDRLAAQVQLVRTIANRDPATVQRTIRERGSILVALEARDADAAAQLMEAHIDNVRQAVVRQLQQLEVANQAAPLLAPAAIRA